MRKRENKQRKLRKSYQGGKRKASWQTLQKPSPSVPEERGDNRTEG